MEDLKQAEKQYAAGESRKNQTGGFILIGLGIAFLTVNYSGLDIENWWAFFILVPVAAAWTEAFRIINRHGAMTHEAASKFVGSLFPLFVACIFLFQWDWGQVWPGFIILAGFAALMNARR